MPKFAANLSMMFTEVPFLDRFSTAAEAGFRGVEYLFPYDHPVGLLEQQLSLHRLENVLFNMPAGDWAAGERGIGCIPGREEEFRAGVALAIDYARRLKTRRLHAMAGLEPKDADPATLRSTYIENLRYAAAKCAEQEITLLVEAINTHDIPGFYLSLQADAQGICAAVGYPNVKMQMDCYHMQIMEGNLATRLRDYAPYLGHVQIAGVPGRHEPDNGEINYSYLFQVFDEIGYDGWVGCEYRPAGHTVNGLASLRPWLHKPPLVTADHK